MKKEGVVAIVVGHTGVDKKTVNNVIDAFCGTVKQTLADGEDVYIPYFGRFTRVNGNGVPIFQPVKSFKELCQSKNQK